MFIMTLICDVCSREVIAPAKTGRIIVVTKNKRCQILIMKDVDDKKGIACAKFVRKKGSARVIF